MKNLLSIFLFLTPCVAQTQEVVDVEISACNVKSDPEYMYPNRLISKVLKNDTLTLHIGIVRNCEFVPSVALIQQNDSIIIDLTNKSNLYAMCDCCYELKVSATGIADTNFKLILQYVKEDITKDGFIEWIEHLEIKSYPNKYIFPTRKEIESSKIENRYTEDSLKVGLWEMFYENSDKLLAKVNYFIDLEGKSRTKWRIVYDRNGDVTEICAYAGKDSNGSTNVSCVDWKQYLKLEK